MAENNMPGPSKGRKGKSLKSLTLFKYDNFDEVMKKHKAGVIALYRADSHFEISFSPDQLDESDNSRSLQTTHETYQNVMNDLIRTYDAVTRTFHTLPDDTDNYVRFLTRLDPRHSRTRDAQANKSKAKEKEAELKKNIQRWCRLTIHDELLAAAAEAKAAAAAKATAEAQSVGGDGNQAAPGSIQDDDVQMHDESASGTQAAAPGDGSAVQDDDIVPMHDDASGGSSVDSVHSPDSKKQKRQECEPPLIITDEQQRLFLALLVDNEDNWVTLHEMTLLYRAALRIEPDADFDSLLTMLGQDHIQGHIVTLQSFLQQLEAQEIQEDVHRYFPIPQRPVQVLLSNPGFGLDQSSFLYQSSTMDGSSLMNDSAVQGGESSTGAGEAAPEEGARVGGAVITAQALSEGLSKINLFPDLGTKFPSEPLDKALKIVKIRQPLSDPNAPYDSNLWQQQRKFKEKQRRDQEEMRRQSAAFQMPAEASVEAAPVASGGEADAAQSRPIVAPDAGQSRVQTSSRGKGYRYHGSGLYKTKSQASTSGAHAPTSDSRASTSGDTSRANSSVTQAPLPSSTTHVQPSPSLTLQAAPAVAASSPDPDPPGSSSSDEEPDQHPSFGGLPRLKVRPKVSRGITNANFKDALNALTSMGPRLTKFYKVFGDCYVPPAPWFCKNPATLNRKTGNCKHIRGMQAGSLRSLIYHVLQHHCGNKCAACEMTLDETDPIHEGRLVYNILTTHFWRGEGHKDPTHCMMQLMDVKNQLTRRSPQNAQAYNSLPAPLS